MKKLILLLIALSILCLPSCKLFKGKNNKNAEVSELCEIAKTSNPTKIITDVAYLTNAGDSLSGYYRTTTDGTNVKFEYYYEKIATPEESVATGDYRRIVPVEGTVCYKDGVYSSGDGESWRPGTGTAFDIKLNFDAEIFKNATVSEDGKFLEAKLTAAELTSFIGTDLNANGEVTVQITITGQNLTGVSVVCSTDNGKLTITNSYTYSKQDLSSES